jgi:hypothetical protein
MQSAPSDFVFIGSRDYVHGPTMFDAFRERVVELAGAPAAGFSMHLLRVNETVRANGMITVSSAGEPRPAWGRPAAEMSCIAGGNAWHAALYNREPTPITRRVPAREKAFVTEVELSGALSGTARLGDIRDNSDLFQAVVEANKQVHLKTLTGDPLSSEVRFRFVYCLDYTCAPSTGDGTATVSVTSEGLRDAGEYLFSLTRLVLRLGAFESTFKLCFASADMKSRMQAA